jgi:putative tricarboxylic transport membrane protein
VSTRSPWWPVATPLAFAAAGVAMTGLVTDQPEMVAQMTRGVAGPTTWPTVMLWALVVFALGWAVERAARVLRSRERSAAAAPQPPAGWRVWVGIVLVLAYGFSLPTLGFAVATPLYLLLWMLLGGVRSPALLAGVTLIGSVALMYMFIKLALMPLDRGVGAIGEFTVQLYRWLGIY